MKVVFRRIAGFTVNLTRPTPPPRSERERKLLSRNIKGLRIEENQQVPWLDEPAQIIHYLTTF